jgi:hypothetical protein
MGFSASLLPEFDLEMANTRKALEQVPEGKLEFKPHEKAFTLGWVAGFLAVLPGWTVTTLNQDSLDLAPGGVEPPPPPPPRSRPEILERFDINRASARAALEQASDERWMQPWSLLRAGHTVLTLPRAVVMRSFVMNHLVHHRGQLTVYLRMTGARVPSLYGPSGDDPGW